MPRRLKRSKDIFATSYGVLLALLLYCSIGDRNYLTYVLFVAGMAIAQLFYNGLGNQFLWSNLLSFCLLFPQHPFS